jgi:stage III sporulation protein AB
MDYKWIGAVLIVTGCGGFGFSLAANHRRKENLLRNLIGVLDYMACELHYRVTPLPALCRSAAREGGRELGWVLSQLARSLEEQAAPDAAGCLETILLQNSPFPPVVLENLRLLGASLGRFDLDGQLQALENARASCRKSLEDSEKNRELRLRNYQTLSLCAGAALALILI